MKDSSQQKLSQHVLKRRKQQSMAGEREGQIVVVVEASELDHSNNKVATIERSSPYEYE